MKTFIVIVVVGALMMPLYSTAPVWAESNPGYIDIEPTVPVVVDALVDVGSKVLDSATDATVSGQAIVSRAEGIEVTVPRDPTSPVEVSSAKGEPGGIEVGIPGADDSSSSIIHDGVSIFTNDSDATATAVNPLAEGGVQFLVAIGSAKSPTRYDFPITVPDGAGLRLTEDGGAEVVLAGGEMVASIPAPWAVDANQRPIATHFELSGHALVQVVDHVAAEAAYPVVADPSVFSCDWWTHICIKSTKTETKTAARHINAGLGVGAAICIGFGFAGGIPGVICGIVLAIGGGLLADTVTNAAAAGKCVELHFLTNWVLTHWKTEKC